MNKNIEKLFLKIISKEDLFNRFIEQKNLNDLYKFAINVQGGYTKDEFKEFIAKIIKFIENRKPELLNNETKLSMVSGGRNPMKSKIASTSLAALTMITSIPTSCFAKNINTSDTSVSVSQKNDDNFMYRAKKAISKFYDEHKKAILLSGGGSIVVSALIALFFKFICKHDDPVNKHSSQYSDDTPYSNDPSDPKYYTTHDNPYVSNSNNEYTDIINEYVNRKTQSEITFNEWFEKLNGTKGDIEQYKSFSSSYDNAEYSSHKKKQIISYDAHRSHSIIEDFKTDESSVIDLLIKIFIIFDAADSGDYTQGDMAIAAIVIGKFLKSNCQWNIEDEAKIYYITKTLVSAVYGNDNSEKLAENFDQAINNALSSKYLSGYSFEGMVRNCLILPTYRFCATNILATDKTIDMWDNILNNYNNINFNPEEVKNKFMVIVCSLWVDFFKNNLKQWNMIPDGTGKVVSECRAYFLQKLSES